MASEQKIWSPALDTSTGFVLISVRRHDAVIGGGAKLLSPYEYMTCERHSTAKWPLTVVESGWFEVYIGLAIGLSGAGIDVSCRNETISDVFPVSNGYFTDPLMNFNRKKLSKQLYLEQGVNTIHLGVQGEAQVYAIELCREGHEAPWSGKTVHGAEMDWFTKAGYGIMIHWTSQSYPRYGAVLPYSLAVEQFDVNGFAEQAKRTGARYVMLTVNHADPSCPAPISQWEAVCPGWTTQRDLIAELANALEERGLRLMLYVNCHVYGRMEQCRTREEFLSRIIEPLCAIGQRYGEHIAGYWFDSWYQVFAHFGDFPMEQVREAVTAGHPGRICCFNSWILPGISRLQDFWAGEVCSIVRTAEQPVMGWGPGEGIPYHMLLMMDDPWLHGLQDTQISEPRFTSEDLGAYLKETLDHGGVVTINMGIYQEGLMSEDSIRVLCKAGEIAQGN